MAELLKNLHVCGNILSSASYSFFALQCAACACTFGQWTSFLRHLEQIHGSLSSGGLEKDKLIAENMHVFEVDNINDTETDDLALPRIEEEHSVFLESKEEIHIDDDNETDEIMVEILQNESNESRADNFLEQRSLSIDSLAEENQMETESLPSSPTVESAAGGDDFKKFRFNLNDSEYLLMSLDFLKVFQVHRLLWDPKHEYYRSRSKRLSAQSKMKWFFMEKRIDISDKVLQTTISTLLRKYKLAQQEKSEKGEVEPETEHLLQKCAFLDGTVQADEADDTFKMSSESVNEGIGVSNETYYPAKNTNHIPFTEVEPIFADFIERYKDNPILWNSSLYNYNHRLDRKQILASWCEDFKAKYDLQLTYDELSFSILEFRRIYYKNVQRRDSNAELDDLAKFILDKGSFLPPKNTIQPVKCQHCSKIFHQEHTLKRHIYMDHGIGDKPFKCGFCEQSFEDHLIHRRHEQRYHYKDYKYICEYCTKAFFTRDELDRHLMKHTGEKKFVCELCGRGFAKKTNLSLHNTRVHLRQRNFACSMCPKAFYTKRLLQDHINAHLNIRDKICPTCGKGFTSHHSLIRHKQIHAEIKKYVCKLCDARFHQFVGLNSHMKNTHKYVRDKNETVSDEQ